MPIQTKTKTINEVEFQVEQLGFSASRKTLVLLSRVLGPSVRDLLSELSQLGADTKDKSEAAKKILSGAMSMDVAKIGSALGGFLERLSERDLDDLTKAFEKHTCFREEGARGFIVLSREDQELLFAGDGIKTYFLWLAFCVEVNYSSFFSGASGRKDNAPSQRTPDPK